MASERAKNLAVHFEKIAYGGAGLLAVIVFLIPFLSTRDLLVGYDQADKAQENFKDKTNSGDTLPTPPIIKKALEEQWAVAEVAAPWVSPWSTEVKPAVTKLKIVDKAMALVHEAGKVGKITPVRDPKKLRVLLKVEGS